MPAQILDGAALARQIRAELADEVIDFIENNIATPTLAAVLVGADPASEVYVRNKRRDCDEVGMQSQLHRLGADATQKELLTLIAKLNKDEAVHTASSCNCRCPSRSTREPSSKPSTPT
jgi:methylenetetrahydrofolate dehydrogenase (NADP+)/methenyltetrahydrofolate cyclohydrolase